VDRLTRSQIVLYAAAGIALLLVGARWMSAPADGSAQAQGVQFSSPAASSGSQGGVSSGAIGGEDVVVDVTGAVSDAGVYRLPAGSRVDDALKRAGGATAGADVEHINLAARLTDGQQVAVPKRVSVPAAAAPSPGSDPTASASAPISLSSATVADLDTIDGIGPVTAQDIIDFRDQHGGIGSIDDLDQISGIGPATMEALRARLQP